MDLKPNVASYTDEELLDVKRHIDKERYPDRYQEILNLLADPNREIEKIETRTLPSEVNSPTWRPRTTGQHGRLRLRLTDLVSATPQTHRHLG